MRVECELKQPKAMSQQAQKASGVIRRAQFLQTCCACTPTTTADSRSRRTSKDRHRKGGGRGVLLVAAVESVRRDAEQLDDRLRDGKTGQYQ